MTTKLKAFWAMNWATSRWVTRWLKRQASYAIVAARDAISATSGVASQLSRSQLGDIAEGAINAKYSRDKESEADAFSFDLLKKRGISTQGLVGSFEKLASLDGVCTQLDVRLSPTINRACATHP